MSETVVETTEVKVVPSKNWGWPLFLGLLALAAGAFAIVFPLAASVGYSLFFGALLVVGGLIQGFDAFRRREEGDLWFEIGLAVLALIAGGIFLFEPMAGVFSLTLVFGVFFIIDATLRFLVASRPRLKNRRWWIVVGGLLSLVLGLIILFGLPETALYTVGILWGVHAIFLGVHMIAAALAARKLAKNL